MHKSIIIQLNDLNQKFYQQVADDFNESRNYFWPGWDQLLPIIKKIKSNNLEVLDLGCGNGRFAEFLIKNNIDFEYTGVDNSQQLLDIAAGKLKNLKTCLAGRQVKNCKLINLDIINNLLNNQKIIKNKKFDLIILFGVLHHIPSSDLRQKLFENLNNLLNKNGLLVITAWQFLKNKKLKSRLIDPKLLNINQNNLENHDYILDWRRGQKAFRYCHYLSDLEFKKLINNKFKILNSFEADSKTNNLNKYYILKKLIN